MLVLNKMVPARDLPDVVVELLRFGADTAVATGLSFAHVRTIVSELIVPLEKSAPDVSSSVCGVIVGRLSTLATATLEEHIASTNAMDDSTALSLSWAMELVQHAWGNSVVPGGKGLWDHASVHDLCTQIVKYACTSRTDPALLNQAVELFNTCKMHLACTGTPPTPETTRLALEMPQITVEMYGKIVASAAVEVNAWRRRGLYTLALAAESLCEPETATTGTLANVYSNVVVEPANLGATLALDDVLQEYLEFLLELSSDFNAGPVVLEPNAVSVLIQQAVSPTASFRCWVVTIKFLHASEQVIFEGAGVNGLLYRFVHEPGFAEPVEVEMRAMIGRMLTVGSETVPLKLIEQLSGYGISITSLGFRVGFEAVCEWTTSVGEASASIKTGAAALNARRRRKTGSSSTALMNTNSSTELGGALHVGVVNLARRVVHGYIHSTDTPQTLLEGSIHLVTSMLASVAAPSTNPYDASSVITDSAYISAYLRDLLLSRAFNCASGAIECTLTKGAIDLVQQLRKLDWLPTSTVLDPLIAALRSSMAKDSMPLCRVTRIVIDLCADDALALPKLTILVEQLGWLAFPDRTVAQHAVRDCSADTGLRSKDSDAFIPIRKLINPLKRVHLPLVDEAEHGAHAHANIDGQHGAATLMLRFKSMLQLHRLTFVLANVNDAPPPAISVLAGATASLLLPVPVRTTPGMGGTFTVYTPTQPVGGYVQVTIQSARVLANAAAAEAAIVAGTNPTILDLKVFGIAQSDDGTHNHGGVEADASAPDYTDGLLRLLSRVPAALPSGDQQQRPSQLMGRALAALCKSTTPPHIITAIEKLIVAMATKHTPEMVKTLIATPILRGHDYSTTRLLSALAIAIPSCADECAALLMRSAFDNATYAKALAALVCHAPASTLTVWHATVLPTLAQRMAERGPVRTLSASHQVCTGWMTSILVTNTVESATGFWTSLAVLAGNPTHALLHEKEAGDRTQSDEFEVLRAVPSTVVSTVLTGPFPSTSPGLHAALAVVSGTVASFIHQHCCLLASTANQTAQTPHTRPESHGTNDTRATRTGGTAQILPTFPPTRADVSIEFVQTYTQALNVLCTASTKIQTRLGEADQTELWYCARFPTAIHTRGCNWFPHLLA
jgi:hypothetical protein